MMFFFWKFTDFVEPPSQGSYMFKRSGDLPQHGLCLLYESHAVGGRILRFLLGGTMRKINED